MPILKYIYMHGYWWEHKIQKITITDFKGLYERLMEPIETMFDRVTPKNCMKIIEKDNINNIYKEMDPISR